MKAPPCRNCIRRSVSRRELLVQGAPAVIGFSIVPRRVLGGEIVDCFEMRYWIMQWNDCARSFKADTTQ
jgi:hypothetical protein